MNDQGINNDEHFGIIFDEKNFIIFNLFPLSCFRQVTNVEKYRICHAQSSSPHRIDIMENYGKFHIFLSLSRQFFIQHQK